MEGCRMPNQLKINDDLPNNWRKFNQAFDIFMKASGKEKLEEEVRIAIFLNCIGEEALELFNTFKLADADKKLLTKVKGAFESYIKPKTNIIYERYMFYKRSQGPSETFDSFYTDLKKLVKSCGFDKEDDMIRDRIVV